VKDRISCFLAGRNIRINVRMVPSRPFPLRSRLPALRVSGTTKVQGETRRPPPAFGLSITQQFPTTSV